MIPKKSQICFIQTRFQNHGYSCTKSFCNCLIISIGFIFIDYFLNITTIDGNGAEFFDQPNFKRHLTKRISDFFRIKSWNRLVSVLAGKSITTTPPLVKYAFWTRFLISLQYGGLQKTFWLSRDFESPSSSFVKYFSHFAFSGVAHGSRLNLNSWFNSSKKSCGVARMSVVLVNIPWFNIISELLLN